MNPIKRVRSTITSVRGIIGIWMAPHCLECGQPKPKFTAICEDCANRFGKDYGLGFYVRLSRTCPMCLRRKPLGAQTCANCWDFSTGRAYESGGTYTDGDRDWTDHARP